MKEWNTSLGRSIEPYYFLRTKQIVSAAPSIENCQVPDAGMGSFTFDQIDIPDRKWESVKMNHFRRLIRVFHI